MDALHHDKSLPKARLPVPPKVLVDDEAAQSGIDLAMRGTRHFD